MKVNWFHLMPYRWLPDDFRERYHGVWVDLPNALYDPERGHTLYNEYLDMLEYADQMGFDAVGVNEHHQNGYGMMPSPNLMAAALARRTSKAMILVLGNSIALYNPPTRVAEEFAMLDVISGGRLIAGFPVGTPMDTNYCYGQNPVTLREKYREAHDLIIKAWAAREPFAWNGKYTKLRYVNIWPQPIQKPHPPIWVPGLSSIETWDFCAERGYNYSYLSFSGYKRRRRCSTVTGSEWPRSARSLTRTVAPSHSRSASATPTKRASASGGRTWIISSTAACTSILAWPRRPVIQLRLRSEPQWSLRPATLR